MSHSSKLAFSGWVAVLLLATLFNPPDQIKPLERSTLERYLQAMGTSRPVDFSISFDHIRPDGSMTRILCSYWIDPDSRQWYGIMKTRLYGPGYLQWEKSDVKQKNSSPGPGLEVYDSLLPTDTLKKFAQTILNSGLYEISLGKITYETARVEHPVQKGRWYIGENWYWDDPKNLLCQTESCRKANRGEYLSPTLEDFTTRRAYVSIRVGSGNFDMRWATDRLEPDAPFAPFFSRVIAFVEQILIPFARKNYFDLRKYEGNREIYKPTQKTPQWGLCQQYSPRVCGFPTSIGSEKRESG
ncbi:MAG: hypothetical protein V2G33_07805 [bacterium JZ-2024 1]